MSTLATVGVLAVDTFTVAGVVWPYIPQARSIWKEKNPDGFSLMTSLVVIISATTRVFYWIEKQYPLPLFIQAIFSVLAQMGMVFVVVRTRQHNKMEAVRQGKVTRASVSNKRTFSDLEWSGFWAWDDFSSFVQFEAVFIMTLLLLQAAFGSYYWFVELQGMVALGIEALLPVPQAIKNYKTKSTAGLSAVLIGSWVVGDAFKVFYAVAKEAPAPFILCGGFQFCVDLVVAAQLFWCYRDGSRGAARGRMSDADSIELAPSETLPSLEGPTAGSDSGAATLPSPRSSHAISVDSVPGVGLGGDSEESESLISSRLPLGVSSGSSAGSRTSSRSGKRFASTSSSETDATPPKP